MVASATGSTASGGKPAGKGKGGNAAPTPTSNSGSKPGGPAAGSVGTGGPRVPSFSFLHHNSSSLGGGGGSGGGVPLLRSTTNPGSATPATLQSTTRFVFTHCDESRSRDATALQASASVVANASTRSNSATPTSSWGGAPLGTSRSNGPSAVAAGATAGAGAGVKRGTPSPTTSFVGTSLFAALAASKTASFGSKKPRV